MEKTKYGFDTLQVHAGQTVDPLTKSRAVPIYQTTSYMFDNTMHAQNLFALKENGNIYTRIMNPTTDVFEKRVAALESGVGALALASGMAAINCIITTLLKSGQNIVSANTIYGGTHSLFVNILPKMGIDTKFVNPDDVSNFENAIDENTRMLYIESIGNPVTNIIDIEAVAILAHKNNIPLVIDSTFATPYLLRPIEYGADIVVHSATKFIGGHGTSIGGVIIDSGNFDWEASGKFPEFLTPDNSYHGVVYAKDFGNAGFITKARVQVLRDTGACISPMNSFLLLQGLETLSLRVEKHISNTKKVIEYLKSSPYVSWISYPNLEDSKYKALADKYFPKGAGSIFAFGIKGGREAGMKFIENVELFSHLANVADAKSLLIHPATTTHAQLNDEELITSGVSPDMIRISIGIEDADDLIYDLDQALAKSQN